MNTLRFLCTLFFISSTLHAQDINQAKKMIDAEQYQKAKNTLKSLINAQPGNGKNHLYLANIYLTLKDPDSAKIYLNQGLNAGENSHFNHIGLGQINLETGNTAAAQADFDKATKDIKKKDAEELLLVGKAFLNSENPNYKKAIDYLSRAIATQNKANLAEINLSLGDAHFADGNVNEAYKHYRDALSLNNNLIRAELQMGVITKNSKAFSEAIKKFEGILKTNPSYGPAYRELAETYNYWAVSEPSKYVEYNKTALDNYKKYLSFTDSSLSSRMRYADFLILTKDYVTLEAEAKKIQEMDNKNPRIYRYLGYAAYHNGNYQESITALNNFFANNKSGKFIASDYLFLAKSKLEATKTEEGNITDLATFESALADLEKAIAMDASAGSELSELGANLYKAKNYEAAAKVFLVSIKNKASKTYVLDNFYLGNSVLFYASGLQSEKTKNNETFTAEEHKKFTDLLTAADEAYEKVIESSPTTHDAHLNKAKINRMINDDASIQKAATHYEGFITAVTVKEDEMAKSRTQRELVNTHVYLGAHYATTDKQKALEHFRAALKLNPDEDTRRYLTESIEVLSN